MNTTEPGTAVAGVDVSRRQLDMALHAKPDTLQVANTAPAMPPWLARHGVTRVGLEATCGNERAQVAALERAGFAAVVHQPLEGRLFARLKRLRARTDRIDAALIAAATAQADALKPAADPRLAQLAERLRHQVASLRDHKRALARDLTRRIQDCPDLRRRFDLVRSLPGIGPIVAQRLRRSRQAGQTRPRRPHARPHRGRKPRPRT